MRYPYAPASSRINSPRGGAAWLRARIRRSGIRQPLKQACARPLTIAAVLVIAGAVTGAPASARDHRQPGAVKASSATLSAEQVQRIHALVRAGQPVQIHPTPVNQLRIAARYFCQAARNGSVDALTRLGWMYASGDGVAQNRDIASTLFRRAAAHGDQQARALFNAFVTTTERTPRCLRTVRKPHRKVATVATRKTNAAASGLVLRDSPDPQDQSVADSRVLPAGKPPSRLRIRVARAVTGLARHYKLDPRLVMAIAQIESGFRTNVVSNRQAAGLMQLTPDTAARFGVKDAKNWEQNLRGGMAYLRWLLAYFRGDVTLAVAAYNAGEGNVNKYNGVPPFPETMRYVQKLRTIYHRDWHPYDNRIKQMSPAVAGTPQPPADLPVALIPENLAGPE